MTRLNLMTLNIIITVVAAAAAISGASGILLASDPPLDSLPYYRCGTTAGCFAIPAVPEDGPHDNGYSACIVNKTCLALATFNNLTTAASNALHFDVYIDGSATPYGIHESAYVALGFSNDAFMADTVTVTCISLYGVAQLQTTYIPPANHGNDKHSLPMAFPDLMKSYFINNHTIQQNNNILKCSFDISTTTPIVAPMNVNATKFNLNVPIFVLLAQGTYDSGKKFITYHNNFRAASAYPILLSDINYQPATTTTQPPTTTTTASNQTTIAPTTTTSSSSSSTVPPDDNGIPYSQCDHTFGCFALSAGGGTDQTCIANKNCLALATYRAAADSAASNNSVALSVYRDISTVTDAAFYVGIGFANACSMKESVIVACLGGDVQQQPDIALQKLFAITQGPPQDFTAGLEKQFSNGHVNSSNGILQCSFNIATQPVVVSLDNNATKYDFAGALNILLAVGPTTADKKTIDYHHKFRNCSTNAIELLKGGTNDTTTTTTSTTTTASPPPPSGGLPYDKCGKSQGCFGMPSGCVTQQSCKVLAAYAIKTPPPATQQLSDATNTTSTIAFDLYLAGVTIPNPWVALGFNNEGGQMEKSAIIECLYQNSNATIVTAYAPDMVPPTPTDFGIPVTLTSSALDANTKALKCSFEMPSGVIDKTPEKFDVGKPLYLIVATGAIGDNGVIAQHSQSDRLSSDSAIDLTKFTIAGGAGTATLIKLHAAFMLCAWLLCAGIGILSSQFYKAMWPTWKPMGKLFWFHVHRTLMMLVVVLSAAAFIMIFVHVGGWSKSASNIHPYIGIICFAMAFFQPIIAYFRPHPGEAMRVYFNYLHGTIGHVSHLLSIIAIVLATFLESIQMPTGARITMWVFIGYSAVQYILQIIIMFSSAQVQMAQGETRPYTALRNFLFLLHILALVSFTVTMIVYVGLA